MESSSFSAGDAMSRAIRHADGATRPLIVILGPTASGKTDFSLGLAEVLTKNAGPAEIINADSRQLYRYMDIGTAKVLRSDMRGIPHHLLDVLDPKEEITIARYKKAAEAVINRLHGQGVTPVLIGGSMLYVSAIIDGLEPIEAAEPELRLELARRYDADEGKTLHAELSIVDPEVAAGIPMENKVYLIRALEIARTTGLSPSYAKRMTACPYDLLLFGVNRPRAELIERIRRRTEMMFDAGWIDEVRFLLTHGYSPDDPGMKSHGYREIAAALQFGKIDKEALITEIATKSAQYSKRQMTWWRPDNRIQWIMPDTNPGVQSPDAVSSPALQVPEEALH